MKTQEIKTKELKRALKLIGLAEEILMQDSNYISVLDGKEANKNIFEAKLKIGNTYQHLSWGIEAFENNY